MFFWRGWPLANYPDKFEYRDFLISMFAFWMSLYGLAITAECAVDRNNAKRAAG